MTRYTPVYGTISSITPLKTSALDRSCSILISVMSQSLGQVNFVVNPNTYVLGQHTFEEGDPIIAIYDTSAPVPLIYPPQFTAVILAKNDDGFQAMFDFFNEDLLNTDETLKLNISDTTKVLLPNGQTFFYNPGNHYLLVLYLFTTRSVPAITTPQSVIVFCSE
ncbi:hypothetical protein [Lacrimispora aerotolerans]|uniref:hypothetical protein n=1 Tax=Lacrimispora aerotolerans TaxID=36832 RepID=UPI00047C4AA7|nr:hypothetical protein [Lacrimispora aerotolerans]